MNDARFDHDSHLERSLREWLAEERPSPSDRDAQIALLAARVDGGHRSTHWLRGWLGRALPSRRHQTGHPIPFDTHPGRNRLMYTATGLAAAISLLALAASVFTADPATPGAGAGGSSPASAAPGSEAGSQILFELTVPRWALPDDLSALEAGDWLLAAGTDVSSGRQASQANESMRNRAIMVTGGEFLVAPTTEALLWRAPGTPPETTPAGEAITLRPGEAIYLPAVQADAIDPERYLRIANPGAEDATAVTFHVHEGPPGAEFGGLPAGLRWRTWIGDLVPLLDVTEWLAADGVHFRVTRHRADPGTAIESSAPPATSAYLVEAGELEQTISGPGGEFATVWRAGTKGSFPLADGVEQTLMVVGDEAASMLELVATPQAADAG